MFSLLYENKEWLFSGAGCTILTALYLLVRSVRNRRIDWRRPPLEGYYETYHLNTADPQISYVIHSILEIKRDLFGRYSVDMKSRGYSYQGILDADGKNIYLTMDGKKQDERMMIIFCEPLSPDFDILPGVFSAVTEKWEPACGRILAKKLEPSDERSSKRIKLKDSDPRIQNFLSGYSMPIRVSKVQPPKFEELPPKNEENE